MALPMDADSKMKALDTRLAALEKSMQSTNNTISFCVGTSKIIISQNEIRIETQGKLTVRSSTGLDQSCDSSMTIKAGANLTVAASGAASVKANGVLTLKGSSIQQN